MRLFWNIAPQFSRTWIRAVDDSNRYCTAPITTMDPEVITSNDTDRLSAMSSLLHGARCVVITGAGISRSCGLLVRDKVSERLGHSN